jgi:hypothetical protein
MGLQGVTTHKIFALVNELINLVKEEFKLLINHSVILLITWPTIRNSTRPSISQSETLEEVLK